LKWLLKRQAKEKARCNMRSQGWAEDLGERIGSGSRVARGIRIVLRIRSEKLVNQRIIASYKDFAIHRTHPSSSLRSNILRAGADQTSGRSFFAVVRAPAQDAAGREHRRE